MRDPARSSSWLEFTFLDPSFPVFTTVHLASSGQRRSNSSPNSRTRFSCSFLPRFLAKMQKPIPGYQEHSGVRVEIMCEETAEQVFFSLFSLTSASCSCQLKICIQYTYRSQGRIKDSSCYVSTGVNRLSEA